MLKPTKHTDPALSILAVSGDLLKILRRKRVTGIAELRQQLRKSRPGTDRLFGPGASLLFSLGLLEYRPKTDAFEYVGPQWNCPASIVISLTFLGRFRFGLASTWSLARFASRRIGMKIPIISVKRFWPRH